MVACPRAIILGLVGYTMAANGTGWTTGADIADLIGRAAPLLARWMEFRGGHAKTEQGTPATPEHLHRYVTVASLTGALVWTVANVLGNYIFVG